MGGREITVKGPRGSLSRSLPPDITVRQDGAVLLVERPSDERMHRALHGLTRSLVNNMVVGVTEGFRKDLEIVGVGYRATAQGPSKLDLALGFSHTISVDAPDGITFEVPAPTRISVQGIDKEARNPGAPTRFLGGSFAERADTWRLASPLTHVRRAPAHLITASAAAQDRG